MFEGSVQHGGAAERDADQAFGLRDAQGVEEGDYVVGEEGEIYWLCARGGGAAAGVVAQDAVVCEVRV